MKKFLCILLALIMVNLCLMSGVVLAEVGETNGNPVVIGDPSVLPVGPSGKSFIQNPTTYCNPISLTQGSGRVLRGGEPVITMFEDDYYLFVSMQRGYWWSHDFKDWTWVSASNLASGIIGVVEIDGKLYSYAGNSNDRVTVTDDPKSGIWTDAGRFSSTNYGDAAMLYDEETGRLFMYYGWSQILGIRVVELDKTTFKEIGEPVVCIWGDPHNHGWETRYSDDLIFPYFDHREYRPEEYGWTEGGHPLKYNGKYYLLFASIGLEFYSYGHGVYVADDPMGPYVYSEHNPLTMKTTGVAPGAGHGSIFQDRDGNVWTVCMTGYALDGGRGDTLIQLFPTGVDEEGVMHGKVEYGDYPQYLPGVKADPINDNYTGWVLLSLDKRVETSSTLENYWPAFAVDEDAKSYWSAQTGDPGEYMTVDLGAVCDIRGIQVLWDRAGTSGGGWGSLDRYQSYTVEVSNDNQNWTLIIDKSNNPQDLRTDYIELPTSVHARYVKLTNVFTPDNGRFAVKALRVFGNPEEATFTKVENVTAVRSIVDRRKASVVWEPVPGAEGYVVRYGIEPDKLYNSYMVYWDNYLNIRSLNVDPEYYFEVEAFSSGTPHYFENTFETRGRGAELDLRRQPTGGSTTTDRVMTYETYGRDEVYVFENITPGTYTLSHTFGMRIWGPQQLTEEQLIGTSTEPTYTALNLMEFGIGTTRWGTIGVMVYPGETSGRIEVVLKYDQAVEPDVQPEVILTGSDSVQPGSEFTVGINLNTDDQDIYAEDITLNFDPDVFEYVATTGANEDINIMDSKLIDTDTLRIIAANIGGVNGSNSPILNVSFKVKSGVENTIGTIAVTQAKLGVAPSGAVLDATLATKSISIGGSTPSVDKTALISAINNAQSLYDDAVVGTEPGQYPQEAKDALLDAINAAKAVKNDPSATQSQVDNAVTALNTAVQAFEAAVNKSPDINDDGITDVGDLAIVAYYYGKDSTSEDWATAKIADVNGDNKIDIEDLAYVASNIPGEVFEE